MPMRMAILLSLKVLFTKLVATATIAIVGPAKTNTYRSTCFGRTEALRRHCNEIPIVHQRYNIESMTLLATIMLSQPLSQIEDAIRPGMPCPVSTQPPYSRQNDGHNSNLSWTLFT